MRMRNVMLAGLVAATLLGCSRLQQAEDALDSFLEPLPAVEQIEQTEEQTMPTELVEPLGKPTALVNGAGESVFSVTLDQFTAEFNRRFLGDTGREFFQSDIPWEEKSLAMGIHTDAPCTLYTYAPTPGLHNEPELCAYESKDGRLLEISINLDWHGYSDSFYDAYEEMGKYALNVFLPDRTEEEIDEIWQQANRIAHENLMSAEEWYGHGAVPNTVYCLDDVGVYAYLPIGEWLHFCIIPLTQEIENELTTAGAILEKDI